MITQLSTVGAFLRRQQWCCFQFVLPILLIVGPLACSQGNQNQEPDAALTAKDTPENTLADSEIPKSEEIKPSCELESYKKSNLCAWVMNEKNQGGSKKYTYAYDREGRKTGEKTFIPPSSDKPIAWIQYHNKVADPAYAYFNGSVDREESYTDGDLNGIYDRLRYCDILLDPNGQKTGKKCKISYQDAQAGNPEDREIVSWKYTSDKILEEYAYFITSGSGATILQTGFLKTDTTNPLEQIVSTVVETRHFDGSDMEYSTDKKFLSYDGAGKLTTVTEKGYYCANVPPPCPSTSANIPATFRKTNTYDNDGRKIQQLKEEFNDPLWEEVQACQYQYDPSGNMIKETCKNKNSPPDEPPEVTQYTYKRLWEAAGLGSPAE